MSKDRSGYVYLMYSEATDWCKIGHSKNPEQRLAQVNYEVPGLSWKLGCQMYCDDRYAVEKAWHEALSGHRITPGKEWFLLTSSQVRLFKVLCEQVSREPAETNAPAQNEDIVRDPREVIEMARTRFMPADEAFGAHWNQVLQQLKNNRQPLTAAVFSEARVASFDGVTLTLGFPEETSFYLSMALERLHFEQLNRALEQRLGERVNVEMNVLEAA